MSIENNPHNPSLESLLPPKGSEARERLQGIEIHADAMRELAEALLGGESLANGMEIYIGRLKDPASELFSMDYSGHERMDIADIFVPAAGERQLLPVDDRKGFLNVLVDNYLKLQRRANSPNQATAESKSVTLSDEYKTSLGKAQNAFMGIVMFGLDNDGQLDYTDHRFIPLLREVGNFTGSGNGIETNSQINHTLYRFVETLDEILQLAAEER